MLLRQKSNGRGSEVETQKLKVGYPEKVKSWSDPGTLDHFKSRPPSRGRKEKRAPPFQNRNEKAAHEIFAN
jgi:hypothetical protein